MHTSETPTNCVVVGLAGRKGAGKDSAAKALLLNDYTNVKFAGPLKEMLRTLLTYRGVPVETIERMIEGDMKEVPHPALEGRTARYAMQTLGTEWGRDLIGEDIWTNAASDRIKVVGKAVMTDVRFPNEVTFVQDLGGVVYRIERPSVSENEASAHPSELLIDALKVDGVIVNDGTESDLRIQVLDLVMSRKVH